MQLFQVSQEQEQTSGFVSRQVVFEDVRAGLLFVLTFAVQNTSRETRRIRIIPPLTPVFSLNYEPVGRLAPGLDVRAEVEFQLPVEDEADDLALPFEHGEERGYTDKFVVVSGKDKVEVPLSARRPAPLVIHKHAVEFGTVCDEKKACASLSLANKGSRKAKWSIAWDKTLPISFNPSEGILDEGRPYRDSMDDASIPKRPGARDVASLEVVFDATRWSAAEPFRALATLHVPGQPESVIDLSAAVCSQKLRLLEESPHGECELSSADFETIYYGCRGDLKAILFNDGPEPAPYMVSLELDEDPSVAAADNTNNSNNNSDNCNGEREHRSFEIEPRDGTIAPFGRQEVSVQFRPKLPERSHGFKGEECDDNPLVTTFRGKVTFEHAERRGDMVSLALSGRGVRPTVSVTQRVVRFGSCPCYDRRDVVVAIKNTGELPVRFTLSKAPNFSCVPSKGILESSQSQNAVLTFCPSQLGHFKAIFKLALEGEDLVVPIRAIGESSTLGKKKQRPGGLDMLPKDFKPQFKFALSESASGRRKEAEGRGAWVRPKPYETVDLHTTNSWDSSTQTLESARDLHAIYGKLTYSMQELAKREQERRDLDAWLTVQRLKRAQAAVETAAARRAKMQGRDWRDPERGVEIGMERWTEDEEPIPNVQRAEAEPLFLRVPLGDNGKGDGSTDVKARWSPSFKCNRT